MAASHEWTEWHLTPRGWEEGSTKVDFNRFTEKSPPSDRVLTCKYEVKLSSPVSSTYETTKIEWRSEDEQKISALLAKYGDCPKHL